MTQEASEQLERLGITDIKPMLFGQCLMMKKPGVDLPYGSQ
jgi:hypothetical protein